VIDLPKSPPIHYKFRLKLVNSQEFETENVPVCRRNKGKTGGREKMTRALCIFEDKKVENFYPLTLTRPVYDLRCGISTLWEKISRISEENLHLLCREYLSRVTSQRIKKVRVNQLEDLKDEDMLFANGRLFFLD